MVFIGILALALIFEEYRQVRKLNKINYLINTYEHDLENPKLIDEMYDFCLKDRKLKKIMKKYNPTIADQFDEHFTLWPIPQEILDANRGSEFPQNPGY